MTTTQHEASYDVLGKMRHEWAHVSGPATADYGSLGQITGDEAYEKLSQTAYTDPEAGDELYYEAVIAAQNGNAAFERLLLQLFLHNALRYCHASRYLARLKNSQGLQAAFAVAIDGFWEAIKSYPKHRTHRVASRISIDALGIITRSHGVVLDDIVSDQVVADAQGSLLGTGHAEPEAEDNHKALTEVMAVLQWGVDNGTLRADEARLLGRHSIATRAERTEMAKDMDVTYATLQKKVYKLMEKLARAVRSRGLERECLV